MRNSYLVRRFFTLLIAAVILWTVLTIIFYTFVAQPVFTRIKVEEILPRAERLVDEHSPSATEGVVTPFFAQSVILAYELYGNWLFTLNESGEIIISSPLPESLKAVESEIFDIVLREHRELMSISGNLHQTEENLSADAGRFIILSLALTDEDNPSDKIGSLIVLQPMEEMNAGIQSLNFALITSSIIVLVIMVIPVAFAAWHSFKPLESIRQIALNMSEGDFSQRADEDLEGEMGDLARSINYLSESLSTLFQELQDQSSSLQQIIDGIAEGIIAVDREGKIITYNQRLWEVFGLEANSEQFGTPERFLEQLRLDERFSEAIETRSAISYVISKDHRQISSTITPLFSDQDVVTGAVGLFRDVTEAERLEQTRRDYVANVSHELRTPLTSMRALLEPLAEGMVKSEDVKQRYYEILLRETMRLSRLINDMLELSRIQAGSVGIEMDAVNLPSLISRLSLRYIPIAADHDIELSVEGLSDDLPLVWTNEDRSEQIFIILLDNAIKFTPEGGLVKIVIEDHGYYASIAVIDNGQGIAAEDIDHVFDRFYKADKAHNQ
ncbi:MAG: histidine kinase dimerization/phospho-acceptor domain-containing protein, partial [Eubacteriales bacterium]|nr:histidine kinase dimerization/phospho-acceptor domain-containing protein [Eubacteriales bacterium]